MYLAPRDYYNPYGSSYYRGSPWYDWGRWVLLGVIILVAFAVFFGASCIQARARRRRGNRPVYGTGWMAPPPGHGQAQYYGPGGSNAQPQQQQQQYQAPPPMYGEAGGYYGQQSGVEMQPPPTTYQPPRGAPGGYAPPAGPPPGKN